jgi:hypothetical protein
VIVTCRLEFQALAGASRAERFLSCSSQMRPWLAGTPLFFLRYVIPSRRPNAFKSCHCPAI